MPPAIVTAIRRLLDTQYPEPELDPNDPLTGTWSPPYPPPAAPEHPGKTIAELQAILAETQAALNAALNERNLAQSMEVHARNQLQAASFSCTQRTVELENLRTQYTDVCEALNNTRTELLKQQELHEHLQVLYEYLDSDHTKLKREFTKNLDIIAHLKHTLDSIRATLDDPSGRND